MRRRGPPGSFATSLDPLLKRYRLVVLDQRGTGLSGALNCPQLQRVKGLDVEVRDPPAAFIEGLSDDLNTPKAYAELFALAKTLETAHGDGKAAAKADLLAAANLLGFLMADPDVWFAGGADEELKGKVEALLEARVEARADKNWAEADRIRAEIDALGVIVMDSPQGATWRLKEPV